MKDWKFHKRECEKMEIFKTLPPEARDDLMLVGRITLAKLNPTQNVCIYYYNYFFNRVVLLMILKQFHVMQMT